MKTNLLWRFIIIILVAVGAGLIAWYVPPKLGIDLAGGVSQVYELDLTKLKGSNEDPETIAGQVIDVLKRRIDPQGVKNIIWRVVGGKRIQIQMPLADQATRDARQSQVVALEDLQKSVPRPGDIELAFRKHGAEREALLKQFAPTGNGVDAAKSAAELKLLKDLGDAYDQREAADAAVNNNASGTPTAAQLDEQFEARKKYDDLIDNVKTGFVDLSRLQLLMSAADNADNKDAQRDLAAFPALYPLQQAKIETYITAHKKLMALSGGGIDDPAELQRLITKAGVLDFRITVEPSELGGAKSADYENAIKSLQDHGPDEQVNVGGVKARWFAVDPNSKDNFSDRGTNTPSSEYVISNWEGDWYLLCYDDIGTGHPATSHALTHNDPDRKPWSLTAELPSTNPTGGLALPFKPDPGARGYMGDLTDTYRKHQMAILLDDKAITAPNIQSQITDSGEITFGTPSASHPASAIQKEAEQLKQIMDSGSLPAALQSEPISVENISSEMGADNISAGVHSAYVAVAAVVGFMCVYYTITGVFADLALMLNLVLVMASMATLGATFTLPGIAGLVLTLGMAVDANVLINERIREEIHRGASLWMAIKQGYDKVFWTIFDANLTCSLTSIVLIYVGSEEVKGFGVTLLMGLIIHMFTALFVTRTFMMAAVKWGVVKAIDDHSIAEYLKEIVTFTWLRNGHWPFMRVITVSNIDWIGKRHVFWAISAVVMIAGMAAFVVRGQDKYDIEFRGGTQVTFQLLPPAPGKESLSLDEVRKRIESLGAEVPALGELRNVRVYSVGKPEERRFEMQTTIANTEQRNISKLLLEPLAAKFKDVLNTQPAVSVAGGATTDSRELQSKGIAMPITSHSLDQVFAKTGAKDIPAEDVTANGGGVAFLLDQITPPQTAEELTTRIKSTSTSPDFQDQPSRTFTIIPLTAVSGEANGQVKTEPARSDDPPALTRAVLVTSDAAHPYDENNSSAQTAWRTQLLTPEWKLIQASLATPKLFDGVTSFDAVVAGEAKVRALIAIVLSLILIVIYVWIRFGGIRYGLGAIFSLVHDAIVALAGTVLSGVAYNYLFNKHSFLLITDFKINLTMIAAYLTVIGYSVNDTIVIFDRVRELRGKSHAALSPKLINDAINQCFGRTIWTTFTVFIVVLIMYVWGGEGVRGFSFAMLIGVITGAYSTLAIASPMLLTTGAGSGRPATGGENPFQRKELGEGT